MWFVTPDVRAVFCAGGRRDAMQKRVSFFLKASIIKVI